MPTNRMAPYPQPDAAQPHARLLVRANAPSDQRLAVLVQQDNQQCTGPVLVAGGTPQTPPAPSRLAVDKLLTLDLLLMTPGATRACVNRWSFTPRAGRTYLLQATLAGAQCPALLLDVTTADRPLVPPDLLGRAGAGQNCLPLAQSTRMADRASAMITGGQHNGDAVLHPQATTRDLQGLIRP